MESLDHFVLAFGAQKLGDAPVGEVDYVHLEGLAAEPSWAQDHRLGDRRPVWVEDAGQEDEVVSGRHRPADEMEALHPGEGIGAAHAAVGRDLALGEAGFDKCLLERLEADGALGFWRNWAQRAFRRDLGEDGVDVLVLSHDGMTVRCGCKLNDTDLLGEPDRSLDVWETVVVARQVVDEWADRRRIEDQQVDAG